MATRILKAKIINIEQDPRANGRTIVSLEITDGPASYIKAFSIITPEIPMSTEEFLDYVESQDLSPPKDPLQDLRDAIKKKKVFNIQTIDRNPKN